METNCEDLLHKASSNLAGFTQKECASFSETTKITTCFLETNKEKDSTEDQSCENLRLESNVQGNRLETKLNEANKSKQRLNKRLQSNSTTKDTFSQELSDALETDGQNMCEDILPLAGLRDREVESLKKAHFIGKFLSKRTLTQTKTKKAVRKALPVGSASDCEDTCKHVLNAHTRPVGSASDCEDTCKHVLNAHTRPVGSASDCEDTCKHVLNAHTRPVGSASDCEDTCKHVLNAHTRPVGSASDCEDTCKHVLNAHTRPVGSASDCEDTCKHVLNAHTRPVGSASDCEDTCKHVLNAHTRPEEGRDIGEAERIGTQQLTGSRSAHVCYDVEKGRGDQETGAEANKDLQYDVDRWPLDADVSSIDGSRFSDSSGDDLCSDSQSHSEAGAGITDTDTDDALG